MGLFEFYNTDRLAPCNQRKADVCPHKACPFDRKPNPNDCLFSNTDIVVLDIAGMVVDSIQKRKQLLMDAFLMI